MHVLRRTPVRTLAISAALVLGLSTLAACGDDSSDGGDGGKDLSSVTFGGVAGTDFETANQLEPERLNTGITVIGKRAVIPAAARIGRNVRICESARPSDFKSRRVPTGGSVERRDSKPRAASKARTA